MSPIVRLAARSALERKTLYQAVVAVAAIRVLLSLVPSRAIVRAVRRMPTASAAPNGTATGRQRATDATVAWAVAAAARYIPRATCLTQALAAQLLLMRNGQAAELCLGVARSATGAFRAHAWLEAEGRVVIGGVESRAFARLPRLPDVVTSRATEDRACCRHPR